MTQLLWVVGLLGSFFAGGLGARGWFLWSGLCFLASVLASYKEEKSEPEWKNILVFSLIWLGAMGNLFWPALLILAWIGAAMFVAFGLRLDYRVREWWHAHFS